MENREARPTVITNLRPCFILQIHFFFLTFSKKYIDNVNFIGPIFSPFSRLSNIKTSFIFFLVIFSCYLELPLFCFRTLLKPRGRLRSPTPAPAPMTLLCWVLPVERKFLFKYQFPDNFNWFWKIRNEQKKKERKIK